jgi:hypothetical protein
MNLVFPDYSHSILNLAVSVLRSYGCPSHHPSLPLLDLKLAEPWSKRIFLILDGMGDAFVRSQLAETGFFRTHQADTLTSVYPCTTTAATTSMLSGLSPAEHGWLGWSPWFREYGRIIDVFINRDSLSGQEILPAAGELMPFEDLTRQIYAATRGQVGLHQIQPNFAVDGVDTFDQMIERMRGYVALPGPQLILAYWHQPDSLMHMYGPGSQTVQKEVLAYEKQLEDLMNEISDTLLVVSADHGQVPVTREVYLDDYPDILDCLVLPPTLETRAVSFFTKQHRRNEFRQRFQAAFGDCYRLLEREEGLALSLFGPGRPHRKTDDFLGDFLACATGEVIIRYHGRFDRTHQVFHGHHAGLCADEMRVPLILAESVAKNH